MVQGPCQPQHQDPHRQGPHQELLAAQGEVDQAIANYHLLGQELLWDSKCHHQGLLESCPAQVVPLGDPRVAGLEDHWVEDLVARGLRTFCDLVMHPLNRTGGTLEGFCALCPPSSNSSETSRGILSQHIAQSKAISLQITQFHSKSFHFLAVFLPHFNNNILSLILPLLLP